MTRWKLTIEYNGAGYAGWQRQANFPSIQGAVEAAIAKFTQQDIPITAAGRTDAGVHARGQVAHVDLPPPAKPMSGFEIAKAINAYLRPQPIAVVSALAVAEDFHARFSAINKMYRYRIINRSAALALDQDLAWHCKKPLDVAAMQEGARHLIGHHDFTSFRATECQAKSPIKTLDELRITAQDYDFCGGQEIIIQAQGRSFLHHMVRNMVGTLVHVGEGKWRPEDVKVALEAKDRRAGGMTAPPDGLYLMRVDYLD
jgi:tRNA pseudouridine38-40 synthase